MNRMETTKAGEPVQRDAEANQPSPRSLKFFEVPRPSSKFYGRKDVLRDLHESLIAADGRPKPGASVLLYGLGGMGKSEVASKFAHDHEETYQHVFWLQADTYLKLSLSISRAYKKSGLSLGCPMDASALAFSWRNWLAGMGTYPYRTALCRPVATE